MSKKKDLKKKAEEEAVELEQETIHTVTPSETKKIRKWYFPRDNRVVKGQEPFTYQQARAKLESEQSSKKDQ